MTRQSLPWRGTLVRDAKGWTVTVLVQREHIAPEVRIVGKESLRVRREVVRGTAWLPHTVAGLKEPDGSNGQSTSETRREQEE